MFSTWILGKRKLRSHSSRAGQARRPNARIRPQLERLEDRLAPAVYIMVTTTADNLDPTVTAGHAGTATDPYLAPSLRSAIGFGESDGDVDNTITFDPSLAGQTITISSTITNFPSPGFYWSGGNLTIQGPGSLESQRVIISGDPSATPDELLGGYFNFFYYSTFSSETISLSNINFENMAAEDGGSEGGSAIAVGRYGANTLNVDHCDFLNNSVSGAIGINGFPGDTVSLTNCILANNSGEGTGGAITNLGATLNLTSCTLYNNSSAFYYTANQGAGGAIQSIGGDVTLSGCTLSNNSAVSIGATGGLDHSAGGAIWALGPLALNNCILGPSTQNNVALPGNSAAYGGAINEVGLFSSLSIMNCTFAGNSAGIDGGAIDGACESITITGSTFTGNQAIGDSGGAMNLQSNSISISNCTVNNNSASYQGGGLFIDPTTLAIVSSTISGNLAPTGADLYNLNSTVMLINSTVTNIFNNGGTISTPDSVAASLDAQISALAQSGVLTADQAAGLTSKLQAATQSLDNGKLTAGVNQLSAFIHQLNAFEKSDTLTAADVQALIDSADQLITAVS
jgi:hypothetical protein